MNEPRRPDAAWIAEVRARNRRKLGLAGMGAEEQAPSWKFFAVLGILGYVVWKMTT